MIAFGLGLKLPEIKGGFNLSFPSFKFGAKGEVEDSSSSESEDEGKGKKSRDFGIDIKAPKFGFGGKKDKSIDVSSDKPSKDVDLSGKSAKVKVSFFH